MATILAIEPWFGETHKLFLENWQQHSSHDVHLVTLSPRKWKWRMLAGNVQLADQIDALPDSFDSILVSDYVHLPELIGLRPTLFSDKKAVAYFHENQLTYPVQSESERDYAFGLANWMTLLSASKIVWNSRFHMDDFLNALPLLLQHYPKPRPPYQRQKIRDKSSIIPVGLDFEEIDRACQQCPDRTGESLRLLWPHRWEHDKNPDIFFQILFELQQEGLPFELCVLGRSYVDVPPVFPEAKERLHNRIVQWGFVDRAHYLPLIASCDVVVSTAYHENQGLAVIEAIRAGCDPLLPNRLAYPEILPEDLHDHLYPSNGELRRRLRWMMKHPDNVRQRKHAAIVDRFSIQHTAPQLDALFDTVN